jgi:hypothetical protein
MAYARLSLLLCIIGTGVFAQPIGRGVISGTVVEASSGDPVRKAVVTVTWQGTPRSWATTRSDGSGRFIFEGLPAGKYTLRATKAGLGTAAYGANSVRELGDTITLGDGETRADLKLRFVRSGSISGRVVEPDGDPVSGVNMMMLRAGRNLGERILVNYRNGVTNDRGEYKITGIDPGQYYLRCMPNGPVLGPHVMFGDNSPAVYDMVVPQYYGGARESKDAAPLNLRGGEVLTGIDFHLVAEHPATISGRVTGVPPLDPPIEATSESYNGPIMGRHMQRARAGQAVMINLRPADDSQMFWGTGGTAAQPPDYRFEMLQNVPGRYHIQASVQAKDKTYYASQMIDVHAGPNDLVLAMLPAVEVKGQLKIEGPVVHPVEGFTVMLAAAAGPSRQNYSSPVKKDGTFAIQDVPPGEWIVNINPNPAGMFEKSVRFGDKDFLYKRIEIPAGSNAPLNIVVSSNTATVEGEVQAEGADSKRAGILIAPVGKLHTLLRFYYSVLADDSGKFKVSGVAPGKYKVFALEKIAPGAYRNPESSELLDALGEELEVAEGAKVQSHPKLIPGEKAKEILKP